MYMLREEGEEEEEEEDKKKLKGKKREKKYMTADGSPRTKAGVCVCFHFLNKIYKPLTIPTPSTPTPV